MAQEPVCNSFGKFALFVSGITEPLSQGFKFSLKQKKKMVEGHFLSEKVSGAKF